MITNSKMISVSGLPVALSNKIVNKCVVKKELLHWHSGVELFCVRSGCVHCRVNESIFKLMKGEFCFINAKSLHRVYSESEEAGELDVLMIDPDFFSGNKKIYEDYVLPVVDSQEFSHVRIDIHNKEIYQLSGIFDAVCNTIRENEEAYALDVAGYIYMIFRRLHLMYLSRESAPVSYNRDILLLRKMTDYIKENHMEHICLDDIRRAAGISRSKCTAIFKKYCGKPPIAFLNNYRLNVGAKLLLTTDETIADIANECGIGEQSYFGKMFRKEYGSAPSQWRNKNRQQSKQVLADAI